MSTDFSTALKNRRSHYAISKDSVISDERIQEIVNEAVKHTPSSFNSQSARVVVLLGEQHDKLWNMRMQIFSCKPFKYGSISRSDRIMVQQLNQGKMTQLLIQVNSFL